MDEERKLFSLVTKKGKEATKGETKEMFPSEVARLNDLFEKENAPMRWIDTITGEELHLEKPVEETDTEPEAGEMGQERLLDDVEAANEKMLKLFTERPVEFIQGLQRMMGQAADQVFTIWEQYRSAIHNPKTPKHLLIQEPQAPEDLPIMVEMKMILKIFQNDKELDDCLQVKDTRKTIPDIKWMD